MIPNPTTRLSLIAPCIAGLVALSHSGCNIAGGAYPEKGGTEFLLNKGYSSLLAERVVQGDALQPSEIQDLSMLRDANVRFLLARNPNLPPAAVDLFISDRNDFVRSGAARNTSLTEHQLDTLMKDPSHTVISGLAENPSLSEDRQMRLHHTRRPGLVCFAMNPNCAQPLRQAILASEDATSKYWLKVCQDWIDQGIFTKGEDGRWKRVHVSHTPRSLTGPR